MTIINQHFWHSTRKIQISVWIIYMLYETLLIGVLFDNFGNPLVYISHYLIVILLFNFHVNQGLPLAIENKRKSIILIPIVVAFELFIYTLAQYAITILLAKIHLTVVGDNELNKIFILRNIYRGILFLGYATGYYFLRNYINERKKTAQLEKERLQTIIEQQKVAQELVIAQNAFLKAQINPHFLFNSLDFIYHKVNKHSEVAGEAIVKLAEMMRFAIDSNEMGDSIYLGEEIEQVENLLYLYQIRKTTDLNVHFSYSDGVKELRLIPLVILTLVENIFKHGNISKDDDIAVINLGLANANLIIQTMNLINVSAVQNSNQSGLNNVRKRLNYAYGDSVVCQYHPMGNHFKVNIVISLSLLKSPV